MSLDKILCDEYQFQRNKLEPLPDSESDFIALERAYNNLSYGRKLEMANILIEGWRKRCVHAESLLTDEQKESHMRIFFGPEHLKIKDLIIP